MESNITILKYHISYMACDCEVEEKKKKKKKVERGATSELGLSYYFLFIYFFSLNFPIEVELRCTERSRIRWILVALVAQSSPTRGFSLSCLPLLITLVCFFFVFVFVFSMVYSQCGSRALYSHFIEGPTCHVFLSTTT